MSTDLMPFEQANTNIDALREKLLVEARKIITKTQQVSVVKTDEQDLILTALGNELNTCLKQATDDFAEKKAPWLKVCQGMDAAKRMVLTPIENEISRIKSMILPYRQQKEQARLAELAKQQKAVERAILKDKPIPVMTVPTETPKTVYTDKGSSTIKDNWTYVMVDKKGRDLPDMPLDAELYPELDRRFLMVDTKKLTAHAKLHKDQVPVKNVRFYNAGSVAFR